MRTKIMIVLAVFILIALNYGIYEKEQIIKNGEIVLVELAPVDPRSLMQGDYMRLRYQIDNEATTSRILKKGYLVIKQDKEILKKMIMEDYRQLMSKLKTIAGADEQEVARIKEKGRQMQEEIAQKKKNIKGKSLAVFQRFYKGEDLASNEKLLKYKRNWGARIVPRSFMFQEGHREFYQEAKYGVFTFASENDYLLIGLADENFKIIKPDENDNKTED